MKNTAVLLFLFVSVCVLGQQIERITIDSKVFQEKRDILLYLPEAYTLEPQRKFEVVYVFDAQVSQYFDLTHATLQFVNPDVPMIVVGVVSSYSEIKKQNRNTDFLPPADFAETNQRRPDFKSHINEFSQFVSAEIMPYIDSNYRTLPKRIGIGHSNAGTFLFHTLLTKPEIFDAYILVSPNLEYDKQQIVRRFEKFEPQLLSDTKYIFMCNANESNGWAEAHAKMTRLIDQEKFKDKIHFQPMDFSKTENHGTVFPLGLFYGLREFFKWQYEDVNNLIPYYKALDQRGLMVLSSEMMNTLAYNFFRNHSVTDALSIINWAIVKYPNEANLYDSRGEFYEKNNELDNARKSYADAVRILQSQKSKMDQKTYEEKYSYFKGNSDRLNKNK